MVEQPPQLELSVEQIAHEADGVISLLLADADGAVLPPWTPGAHVDLLLAPGLERQYSLCGDPGDPLRWRVAVLREPESRGGSRHVHERLRAGDRLVVRGPRNHFPLVDDVASYLLIAGGIGITPLLAMARELDARGADWSLLYGGRHADSMAFLGELAAFGERVTVHPQDRLGLLDLDAALGTPVPGRAVYCCGPEPLVAAVEQRCAAWPAGALHVERFRPRPGALAGDGEDDAFEVHAARSGRTVTVAPGQSIVDALRQAGVNIPTSCREGTCGTCETTVLEGVPDHRDSFLTEEERAAGDTMLTCCSRAQTPRLVLDR